MKLPSPVKETAAAALSFLVILQNLPQTTSTETLQIPAFGRIQPFGALYDARTVSFIPGGSIFQPLFRIPASAYESRNQVSNTHVHIHPLNSTFSKFNEKDFSQATILSILSEQLKVYGSWRYLVEEPKGESVRYKTELRRKWKREYDLQLNQNTSLPAHMREGLFPIPRSVALHISSQELLAPRNINATHFVVGISYGKSVTAIFQDTYKMRKYGMPEESDATHPEVDRGVSLAINASQSGTLKIVRIYSELHPVAGVDTPEELQQHFSEFENEDASDFVPLFYHIVPLSSILGYLNVNDTVSAQLATRWDPQPYNMDPFIEPRSMVPIFKEFDAVSIAQFRLHEAMELLRDPEFEHVVQNRRQYLLRIQDLQNKFKYSLETFKSHLRNILTSYRLGMFNAAWTFEQALNDALTTYKRDPFSVENVTKMLDTQFQGLHVAICVEKVERTLSNLYGEGIDQQLKALKKNNYRF